MDFLRPAHGSRLPPLRAHPWPSACELGPGAVYGGGRAEPGSGARDLGCGMAAARRRPEPRSWLDAVAGVLPDAEAEGAGLDLEGDCTPGVWISP